MGKAYRLPERCERETRVLPCVFTKSEVKRAAQTVLELEARLQELKAQRALLKAEIKSIEGRIAREGRAARQLFDDREVLCERRYVWAKGMVYVVRLDTAELIETRAMTPGEQDALEQESEEA